jgi:hypothetical protein
MPRHLILYSPQSDGSTLMCIDTDGHEMTVGHLNAHAPEDVRAALHGLCLDPPQARLRTRLPHCYVLPPGAYGGEWSVIRDANTSPAGPIVATGPTEDEALQRACEVIFG